MKRSTPIKRPDPPEGDNVIRGGNRHGLPGKRGKNALRCFAVALVFVSVAALYLKKSSNTSPVQLRSGNHKSLQSTTSKKKKTKYNNQCRYYLAESAIPNGGLGMFTAIDIQEGVQAQSMADICIFVDKYPKGFRSHSWGMSVWHGKYDGSRDKYKSACEGFATLFNTMPRENNVRTSRLVHSAKHNDNGGLHRAKYPGAGAITQVIGIDSVAARDIPAGAELTIDYGDWEFDTHRKYVPPTRTVDWLENHGMCVDNMKIQRATDPQMGRGAFARRDLPKGSLVAPAPVQFYRNRTELAIEGPPHEKLFLNYCLQPKGSDMLLYPYGPGVNLINHASHKKANVELRWSTNQAHHSHWLNLPQSQFWDTVYHGSLILDVVALRDIAKDEEIFLDYGPDFEMAWKEHAKKWVPVEGALDYVYPSDMDIVNEPFRTVEEQEANPYPSNLATICEPNFSKHDRERFKIREWKEQKDHDKPKGRYLCNIIKRGKNVITNKLEYEVSMGWNVFEFEEDKLEYVLRKVPQEAIMFVERPFMSDKYLHNAFRHPIGLPDELVPDQWRRRH